MEFLVDIRFDLPGEPEDPRRGELVVAERERGRELLASGRLRRIWRVPGARRSVAVWEAPDATTLDEALASLPLFPWMQVEVTPLAVHPLELGGNDPPPA